VRAARARVTAAVPSELPIDQTSGALAYLAHVPAPDPAVVRRALASTNGPTRDLFQRFLPASRRRRVLGEGWDEAALKGVAGDAGRGRALFHADTGPQCGRCHRAQGQGREFGPVLDAIASRLDRAALLEQIRWPSRRIAPEFALHQVETRDGLQHSGFVVPADQAAAGVRAPEVLRLRTEGGEVMTLARESVVSDTVSPVSAMPEGLLDALTAQEVADLLAYLAGLRAGP
jgi:putative heme-binding domain-containing protein